MTVKIQTFEFVAIPNPAQRMIAFAVLSALLVITLRFYVLRLILLFFSIGLCVTLNLALAAEIKPALATLMKSGVLVEATWLASETDRFVVRIERCISGCDETRSGTVAIQADLAVIDAGVIGERYVLNYTDVVKAFNTTPKTFARDPNSARLTGIEGATPALFRANQEILALFAKDAKTTSLRAALKGLSHTDPRMADLWSAEIAYEDRFLSPFSSKTAGAIAVAIRNPGLLTVTRMRLLDVLNNRAPKQALEIASEVIQAHPAVSGAISPDAGLVITAFAIIQRDPKLLKAADYRRWLRAEQLSIAENAALSIRAIDANAELEAVEYLLKETLLPSTSRRFFDDHLRRLRIMQKAVATPK